MGRGSSGVSGGSSDVSDDKTSALQAIKEKYPNAVIGNFNDDGTVSFQYKPNGTVYTYKAENMEQLADKLHITVNKSNDVFQNSFFGQTKATSGSYFKMDKQVSDDGNIIAFTTKNVIVKNGSPVLAVGDNQGIYLKDSQYQGVAIKSNGSYRTDAIMVKMSKSDFDNAKRYTFQSAFNDMAVSKTSFNDLKRVAQSQQKANNEYKTYSVAVYNSRIETSAGKKGKIIVGG